MHARILHCECACAQIYVLMHIRLLDIHTHDIRVDTHLPDHLEQPALVEVRGHLVRPSPELHLVLPVPNHTPEQVACADQNRRT